jgi:hypothetical protein
MERKVYPSDNLSGYVVSLILPEGLLWKRIFNGKENKELLLINVVSQ